MKVPVPDEILPASALGRVHLVGVGGAGLSAIARLLHQQGVVVSGSDAHDSDVVAALRAEGLTVHVGHDAAQVADVDTVIVSTAVREDNPEVQEARRRGLRLWPRSAGLHAALAGKRVVAVAGTHGKTTTTAMTVVALQAAGLDPTFAIGAEVASLGTNARWTDHPVAVVEADESDGAFLVYTPDVAVVTNVDADHLDHWGTEEAYAAAFEQFVRGARRAVVGSDDAGAVALAAASDPDRVVTAGFAEGSDVQGRDLLVAAGVTTFTVPGVGSVALAVPGRHYASDALLALAVGLELEAAPDALVAGLARHQGAKRRMELLGEVGGVRVYDSYAHHPTEIRGDLEAARSLAGSGRLVVAFQPHLVSRTRRHGAEMGHELSLADRVVVADLYLAREEPDPEVTSGLVVDAVVGAPASLGGAVETLHEVLLPELEPGDLLLTLGAGDITTVGPRVLRALKA